MSILQPCRFSAYMKRFIAPLLMTVLLVALLPAKAQMVTGSGMKGFDAVFGVKTGERSYPYSVQLARCSVPGNILIPGEQGTFTFQLVSHMDQPLETKGRLDVIPYGARGIPGDIWQSQVVRLGETIRVPFDVKLAPNGYQNVTVKPFIPERKGGYALVVDLGAQGRQFITSLVRTFAPNPKRLQYPKFSLDHLPDPVLRRLGVQAIREGVEWWLPGDPDGPRRLADLDRQMKTLQENNITVMLMVGASPVPQPLGRPRPHLTADGVMTSSKSDMAWLPQYDGEFRKWVARIAARYGWPKGPLTAFNLWNEPWEGLSISGWGADALRYRESFAAMARGVEDARKTGVDLLLAGADSSSNTMDKFFSDGKMTFLPWLDAVTIHYQGMASPAVYKPWRNRKSPHGRVKVWDTESWVANTDDRVAAVVATNRAAGYDRSMGIYGGNIAEDQGRPELFVAPGKRERVEQPLVTAWSTAAAVGAMQRFLGERDFQELLFRNGLPWVMAFNGLNGNADDGTVVVVGDIGEEFGRNNVLFRNVRTLGKKDVNGVRQGTLTLPASPDWSLYDFYGNPAPAQNGKIVVPLDHRGFFLRPSGKPGSFARLIAAVRHASLRGFEPVELIPYDFTAPVTSRPTLRVKVSNVLNRPIHGTLTAAFTGLKVDKAPPLALKGGETRWVALPVTGGSARADNSYPLTLAFDAGKDGRATLKETLHANVITRRTIKVDGDLSDWKGALPQAVRSTGAAGKTVTEAAWFPFVKFDQNVEGFATGYVAYDANHFYFAAKVADSSPDGGTVRFETRDDDAYFYPEVSYEADPQETLAFQLTKNTRPATDSGALVTPDGKGRVPSYWEDTETNLWYAFDLTLPKNRLTQVALYLAPWDVQDGVGVQLEARDRDTGAMLAERHEEKLWKGGYVVFTLAGNVRLRVRPSGDWFTAKTVGLFFDPYTGVEDRKSGTSATYVKTDFDTLGDWRGHYGADGYALAGLPAKLPGDVTLTMPTEQKRIEHRWPQGVRRFSYRKWPDLPAGNAEPPHDNAQIAFNVLPPEQKTTLMTLPGTMPGFVQYQDTDYEYALSAVAPQYGGGTEIWRLQVPEMPRKHFYPRQPKSPFDGPAKGGQLVVKQDGSTRIVECALPWSEIPAVKAAMLAGKPVKFSFLINDAGDGQGHNGAGQMELGRDRSVAKLNPSFHVDWAEHWGNELEFGWGR